MKDKNKTKVFVGMSGGVDSSVTAKLLVDEGYDVTGVFIKVWQPDFFECTWKEDRRDAMRVAAQLGIPFITIHAEKEYKELVVDYMINEYKAGRTPNPDIMCNSFVKFGVFYNKAMELGADYIATGHYARVKDGKLSSAEDTDKDQTYFLWNIKKESLSHILFPVGKYEKDEIRNIASSARLFTADKKDSQGLCFIGKIPIKDFLSEFIDLVSGDVLNEQGDIIGHHKGALVYTIGQRHGFVITQKTPEDEPYYIVAKNVQDNTITVSQNIEITKENGGQKIELSHINQLSDFEYDVDLYARIRHGQRLQKARISREGEKTYVTFSCKQSGLAVGQSCVLYKNNICLGGGIIETIVS